MAVSTTTERASATSGTRAAAKEPESGSATPARDVAEAVGSASREAAARLPEAARAARDALGDVTRAMAGRSDEGLRTLGVGSVGFSLGLFVGGAPRLLVLAALAPAALVAATLADRAPGRP